MNRFQKYIISNNFKIIYYENSSKRPTLNVIKKEIIEFILYSERIWACLEQNEENESTKTEKKKTEYLSGWDGVNDNNASTQTFI